MKFFRSILTVGGLTSFSRILGLLRDMMIAALIGASSVSDVFWVAFKMPNFFRRLLAEGAMAAAFVPLFSRLKSDYGYQQAIHHINPIYTLLVMILLSLVISVEVFTPGIVTLIAPGFCHDPQQFQLAVNLTRYMFPYIFFMALAAFYGCILNTEGKFAVSAASPVILNIMMIMALSISIFLLYPPQWTLVGGILVAGILQLGFVYVAVKKLGSYPCLTQPRLTPFVKEWLKGMAPAAIGAGALQINIFIDTIIASLLPAGSVSYLFYADRLNQLPLSLLGIGISTVLLPHLSSKIVANQFIEAKIIQNRTLEYAMILTIPAAIALMILGCDIICVLFERAEFTRVHVLNTGYALAAFAGGLPAYVLIKIFSTIFFAHHDTKTPVKIGLKAIGINGVANLLFVFSFSWDHIGIALATSLAAWFNALSLLYLLHRQDYVTFDERLKQRLGGILMANISLFGVLIMARWLYNPLAITGFFNRLFVLGGLIALGLTVYFTAAILFRAIHIKEITTGFSKL